MTRQGEIEDALFIKSFQSNHRYNERTFKEAVKWADKTIIEKACEWLRNNADDYCDNGGYGIAIELLLNDFRKAMEK